MLVAIATTAAIVGPRVTSEVRPETTHRMRFALVVMWLAGALLTLVAGVESRSERLTHGCGGAAQGTVADARAVTAT